MPLNCIATATLTIPAMFVGKGLGSSREKHFYNFHLLELKKYNYTVPKSIDYTLKEFSDLISVQVSTNPNFKFIKFHFISQNKELNIIISFSDSDSMPSNELFFEYNNRFRAISNQDAINLKKAYLIEQRIVLNNTINTVGGHTRMMWTSKEKIEELVAEFNSHNPSHIAISFAAYSQWDADNNLINLSNPSQDYVNKAYIQFGMVDIDANGNRKPIHIEDCDNFSARVELNNEKDQKRIFDGDFNQLDMCPPNVNCNDEG